MTSFSRPGSRSGPSRPPKQTPATRPPDQTMRIRILGSAAGGGLPQWNCRCANCEAARAGCADVEPRTQSSVAISADGSAWFLLNVSPDIRQQVLAFPELAP